jgi:hypothetical protein
MRSRPLVHITLTQDDLDRLAGLGVPIWEALGDLDVELQRILGLDWRDIEIELQAEEAGLVRGRGVVERSLRNLGI